MALFSINGIFSYDSLKVLDFTNPRAINTSDFPGLFNLMPLFHILSSLELSSFGLLRNTLLVKSDFSEILNKFSYNRWFVEWKKQIGINFSVN